MIRKFSTHGYRVQFLWLVSLVMSVNITFADKRGSGLPHVIEVFTSEKYPIVETDIKGTGSNVQVLEITVYKIDAIQSVERDLSRELPAVPQQSKPIVLQRIQNLDEPTRSSMQAAATGLAKAMQYGIDRFPAIVFDGQAVVYGETDVQAAHTHYWAWRSRDKP
jgi:integrating conjugative element protein (TIGR03757 family)